MRFAFYLYILYMVGKLKWYLNIHTKNIIYLINFPLTTLHISSIATWNSTCSNFQHFSSQQHDTSLLFSIFVIYIFFPLPFHFLVFFFPFENIFISFDFVEGEEQHRWVQRHFSKLFWPYLCLLLGSSSDTASE